MYVDETGTPSFNDASKYFLLTGVILKESDVKRIKKEVFDFKFKKFSGAYTEAEIHMNEIFRSKKEFLSLKVEEKRELVSELYNMIKNMPITVITAAIDKPDLKQKHQKWDVFKITLIILISKFNQFLESANTYPEKGKIRIDKSTDRQRTVINNYVRMLRKEKKHNQINNIVGFPYFVNSDASEGIQVADAVSYCIGKKLLGNPRFPVIYWDLIKDKIYSNKGKIMGFGLNVFPYKKELKGEDIQP